MKPASLPEQDERRITSPRETEMGFGAQANAQRPPSNGARGLAGKPRRCWEKSEPDSPPAEFPAVRPYRRAAGERRVRPAREPGQPTPRRWRRGPRLLGRRGTARASRAGGPGRRAPASRRHWLGARRPRGRHHLPPEPCGLTAASSTASTRGAAAGAPPRLPRTARPRASWPRPRRTPGRAAHFCECTARTRLPGASRRRGRDDGRAPSGWGFSAAKLGIQSPAPPPRGWRRAGGRTCRTPREGDGVSVVRRAESGSRPRSRSWRSSHTDSAAGGVRDLPPAGGEPRLSVCLVQSCVDTRDALHGPLEGARPHV